MTSLLLRRSTPQQEGVMQVSKWLKCQVLLSFEEMESLFHSLGLIYVFNVSQPVEEREAQMEVSEWLKGYEAYVACLKNGKQPDSAVFRSLFSMALSSDANAVYAMTLPGHKLLVKPIHPVIQMQPHQFFYSLLDRQFHPMVQSQDSVSWGIQFSYPQLFQDPREKQIMTVAQSPQFLNTKSFRSLMRWMRARTLPTPFWVDGVKTNSPIRIGRDVLHWISQHPQLKEQKIEVSLDAH